MREGARAGLAARLNERRAELEQAALARVQAICEPSETDDPEYIEGLRAAVSAALDYGLAAAGAGEEHTPPVPAVLLTQARLAARNGVSLDTVLRRYFAGYTLLGDLLVQEAEQGGLGGNSLQRVMREQAALFDGLIAVITEAYTREAENRPSSSGQRRAERVQRLLVGELVDVAELAYEFDAFHLGLIASGPGAGEATRELVDSFDCRPLVVCPQQGSAWAWLGSRHRIAVEDVFVRARGHRPANVSLALGEPAQGISGWRISHRQARAALPIACADPRRIVRYADVALLACALGDQLLASSLETLYLDPLAQEQDDGAALRRTLYDYFAAGRNVTSTAAALGVSRQTVNSRLRTVEERIGRSLDACAAELETALRLRKLSGRQTR